MQNPPTSWSVQEMLGERRHPVQSRSRKREREGGRRGSSATFRLRKIPAKYPPPPLPTTEVPSRFPQTSRNDGYSLCWAYSNSWRQPEDCRCGEDWGETAVVAILLLLSSPSVRAASLHNWWLSAECEGVSASVFRELSGGNRYFRPESAVNASWTRLAGCRKKRGFPS